MNPEKSRTEQAVTLRRKAHRERRLHPGVNLGASLDRQAAQVLQTEVQPIVGPGGEVIEPEDRRIPMGRAIIRETLRDGPDAIAEDASMRRAGLLMQPSFNAVAMGIDAAHSINAGNSLEKMLAHQLAVSHEAALRLMDRALSYEADGRAMREGDSVEACRLANTSARLMSAFQDGLLTLQRLRNGGAQTVTVQHVNVVQPGAQAVIGNVKTGGRGSRKGAK